MKLLHSFCDPIETMPTVTSYNGRFINSEGTHYYDLITKINQNKPLTNDAKGFII